MEPKHLDDFCDAHLNEVCKHWQLDTERPPRRISASENLVFEAYLNGERMALRFTHPDHQTFEHLLGEIKWVQHLSEREVPCPRILRSRGGRLVEKIAVKDDPVWYAAVFSWAPGQSVSSASKPLSDSLIQSWGSAIGQMQQISIECNRQNIRFNRPHWRDYLYADQLNEIGKSNPGLVDTVTETLDAVEKLEVSHSDFGIAHTDLHGSNLFVDTIGRLTCIDFDDCAYHYFIQDFTMPIYYALLFHEGESLKEETERFFRSFLSGYGRHIERKPNWFEQIPLFLKLRDLDLAIILRLWEEDPASHWFQVNEAHMKEGHPMANFPWSEWAEEEQSKNAKRLF